MCWHNTSFLGYVLFRSFYFVVAVEVARSLVSYLIWSRKAIFPPKLAKLVILFRCERYIVPHNSYSIAPSSCIDDAWNTASDVYYTDCVLVLCTVATTDFSVYTATNMDIGGWKWIVCGLCVEHTVFFFVVVRRCSLSKRLYWNFYSQPDHHTTSAI